MDIYTDNAYEAAKHAQVLEKDLVEALKEPLSKIKPMSAVFDKNYIKRIDGPNVKTGKNKMDLADQLRADIKNFMKDNGCDCAVIVWCASTQVYTPISEVHKTLKAFEEGLRSNDPNIPPSQIYTYAALKERVPYANGSPNISVEIPGASRISD